MYNSRCTNSERREASFRFKPYFPLKVLTKVAKLVAYNAVIRPTVNNAFEKRNLIVWEQKKLLIFENMLLRRIFGPKRHSCTGELRMRSN